MAEDSKTSGTTAQRHQSGVTYRDAEHGYFEKRGLIRHAGAWSLWALGVAAVISGDFSGWNFGIGEAGWGGLLIATVVIGVMYLLMVWSIAEMSSTMPHTGGAYSFGRSAMGPWGGFVTGSGRDDRVRHHHGRGRNVRRPLRGRDHRRPVRFHHAALAVGGGLLRGLRGPELGRGRGVVQVRRGHRGHLAGCARVLLRRRAVFSGEFSWDNLWNIAPEAATASSCPSV